ncbi:MAG: hypothetical protein RLZZ546_2316, partial [Bacteroidota bacterium]
MKGSFKLEIFRAMAKYCHSKLSIVYTIILSFSLVAIVYAVNPKLINELPFVSTLVGYGKKLTDKKDITKLNTEKDQVVMNFGDASIYGPLSFFKEFKDLEIQELVGDDIPALPQGMVNVTKHKKAYRCLPDGSKFPIDITLKLPYEERLIPYGYNRKDIKTFYFDVDEKKWKDVQVDSIDASNQNVFAKTNHFTDYINGIIQAPESPEKSEFVPTAMNDVKAADPVAGLNIMQAPIGTQKGDASATFPIQIPAGRNGMQPQLALQYSSEGGSSWVGYGWSMSTPAITLDTRWGSPLFHEKFETEIYMLNGEQLIYNDKYLPNRHREDEAGYVTDYKKRQNGKVKFYERKLGSFNRIERIGDDPLHYFWKVT